MVYDDKKITIRKKNNIWYDS